MRLLPQSKCVCPRDGGEMMGLEREGLSRIPPMDSLSFQSLALFLPFSLLSLDEAGRASLNLRCEGMQLREQEEAFSSW